MEAIKLWMEAIKPSMEVIKARLMKICFSSLNSQVSAPKA